MKTYFLLLISLFVFNSLYGQQKDQNPLETEHANDAHEVSHHKYKLAVTFGMTYIPKAFEHGHEEEAVFVPTIGLDFFYHINHRWSVGFITDLELGDYIIDFNREDLNRDRAVFISILAGYEILPHMAVLMGGGIELEKHKNLAVLRAGIEYEFGLAKGWNISPSIFFDFKEDFNTWALAVGIGKRF